jgi:signal transduction histidine kinase
VAKLSDIKTINGLMLRSQLISLLISGLIALVLGVFFEEKITKPIRQLSKHMKNYSVKAATQEVRIHANDEIGELAKNFNGLVRKVKKYDEEQKVFFHNASHELKTPLMAIQGNAEGILDGVVSGEDVEKSLNVIIAESQRLKRIVEGIAYLAKLEDIGESFKFTAVPLGDVIDEAVESIQALADQRDLELIVENHPDFPALMLDPEKMMQAFINLLGNAIRYANSEIVVESCVTRVGTDTGKGAAVITVCDDGPGLALGEETKVFQRFYSGSAGGSGIGLAITKTIVEAHGGTITAANGNNGGAVFT